MTQPLTVYLDTADYSRFGDVERGVGTLAIATIYEQLKVLRDQKVVRFAYSMPILSELLQYHADYAETSLAKARAVETLCGRNAFIWPMRLVARDLAHAAHAGGLTSVAPSVRPVSDTSGWFPSVQGAFDTLKEQQQATLQNALAKFNPRNRAERRKIEARAKKLNSAQMVAAVAPELAEMYGLRPADVRNSITSVLEDRITPEEGAQRLFSAIAEPTAFIQTYFVRHTGEKDMPTWMSGLGMNLQKTLLDTRARIDALELENWPRPNLRQTLLPTAEKLAVTLVQSAEEDALQMQVPKTVFDQFAATPNLASSLPSCAAFVAIALELFVTNTGLRGDRDQPEESAGGDLFHSLYLPHCDLWRTDKRFAHIVKKAVPDFAPRIVARLEDLPAAIAAGRA